MTCDRDLEKTNHTQGSIKKLFSATAIYIVGFSVRKERDLLLSACLILFISSKMSVRASANRKSTFNAMFTVDTCFNRPLSSFRDGKKLIKFLQKCI